MFSQHVRNVDLAHIAVDHVDLLAEVVNSQSGLGPLRRRVHQVAEVLGQGANRLVGVARAVVDGLVKVVIEGGNYVVVAGFVQYLEVVVARVEGYDTTVGGVRQEHVRGYFFWKVAGAGSLGFLGK